MEQNAAATMPAMDSGKQNDGKGWKIATAIASVVAVCGIGFGIYGAVSSFQKDSQISDLKVQIRGDDGTITTIETPEIKTTTEDGTTVTITDSATIGLKQVRNLLNDFINFDYNVTSTENNLFGSNGLTEQYKYYLALKKLNYADKVSATHEDAGMPGGNTADYEYSFTYDDINNAYHSLFGSGSNVQNQENFWCFVPFFSTEYNKYISITRCGGVDPSTYAYEILDYSVNGNKLTVDIAYIHIFEDYNGGEWKKYIALNSGNEEIYGESSSYLSANYLKEHENDLPKYRLTFEKEGSNYIFTDVNKL